MITTAEDNLKEAARLLRIAQFEVKHLRSVNEQIGTRLEIYDNMMSMFYGGPRSEGMKVMNKDVVHDIDIFLNAQKYNESKE